MNPRKQHTALSEKNFRALIENAHEGIVLYSSTGEITFASQSVARVTGYAVKSLIGKKGTDFLHADDKEEARKVFAQVLSKPGKSITFIQRIRHKRGHYLWSESRLTNFTHIREIKGIVSNFRDITDKREAEEKAERAAHLLGTINHNLTEGIYMGVIGKGLLYVNLAYTKMFGYRNLEELNKINLSELYADETQRKHILYGLRVKRELKGVEVLFRRKNGEVFWGSLHANVLEDGKSKNIYVGTVRDISVEKQAAADLMESRNFLNNIINTVGAPIFVKDSKHRWILFNDKFTELAGRTPEQLLGKSDKDYIPAKEARVFWKIDNEVLRTGKTIRNEERITSSTGKVHEILTVKSRYINEKGKKFVIGFITDITEIKKAEEKINQLNANLRGILESTQESVYAVDNNFQYLAFNQNHKRIMKVLYKADIEVGKNKLQYFKGHKDGRWVKEEIKKALTGHHFISEHYLTYKGFTGFVQTTFNPIRNDQGEVRGAAVFVNDITPRKEFERIIKSVNANLRALLESTNDHILAVDKKYRYIIFNKAHAEAFKNLFGADLKGGDSLLSILTPELAAIAKREINKALRGKQFIIEEQLVKDIVFEVSLNPIREKREITGVAIFARDITLRKTIEAKLKLLNEELVQQNIQLEQQEAEQQATLEELSERNFELDQLMYKTSHDLRSPLSSIMGLVNLANLDDNTDNHKQYLEKIEGRIKKLDDFISSMLNYARVNRAEVSTEKINLKSIAETSIRELEYLDNFHTVEIRIECKGQPVITSDLLRIRIIFSNIISNAYKYYNPDVKSRLGIRITRKKAAVEIEFKDNGIGIKPEHKAKIFNMFYRATERSQGSGLGMYIVKQAVEKLNGEITLTSEYGEGTTIHIILPLSLKVKP